MFWVILAIKFYYWFINLQEMKQAVLKPEFQLARAGVDPGLWNTHLKHVLLHPPMHIETGVCVVTQLEILFVVNTDGQKFCVSETHGTMGGSLLRRISMITLWLVRPYSLWPPNSSLLIVSLRYFCSENTHSLYIVPFFLKNLGRYMFSSCNNIWIVIIYWSILCQT